MSSNTTASSVGIANGPQRTQRGAPHLASLHASPIIATHPDPRNSGGGMYWSQSGDQLLQNTSKQIDQAVGALFAFALELAVSDQTIEACPRLATIAGAGT